MGKNKIKFGLSNTHYSLITETDGAISFGTPVKMPGSVNLTLAPQGDTTPFYADDIEYFTSIANNGYDGTLELALVPEQFCQQVLGETLDEKKIAFENADVITKPFALLFQFLGDANNTRHVFYYCKVTRPNVEGSTKGASIEAKTETLNITARPRPDTKDVKAKTTSETDAAEYDDWFKTVYTKKEILGV